ncbi:MAG: molybdenum cofactor guanylyltransferase [Anaerolineaceae bacterium]
MKKLKNLTLVIQAGGFSKRMGQDKALLIFNHQPLIAYIADRGRLLTDDLFVTTNQIESYRFLNLPLYPDLLPLRGTLVGMHTALSASTKPFVAVVGCDMPFFNPQLLAYEAQLLEECGMDAVVPRSREGLEPLHAVYRREICLAAVKNSLEMDVLSLIGWLKLLKVLEITEDQIKLYDPNSRAFINLNTPEEFQQAEKLLISNVP